LETLEVELLEFRRERWEGEFAARLGGCSRTKDLHIAGNFFLFRGCEFDLVFLNGTDVLV
jgi:hypothetical protein